VIGGLSIIVTNLLPFDPAPGLQAERMVRHGLADVLAWLGEDVGPEPDFDPVEVLHAPDRSAILVSPRVYALLSEEARNRYSIPQRIMAGMEAPDTVDIKEGLTGRTIRTDVVGPDA